MHMEKKTSVFKNIIWVMKSIFQYDHHYLFILGVAAILIGLFPPLATIVSQSLMNALQERSNLHILMAFVMIYVGIDLFQTLFESLVVYYKFRFAQGYNLYLSQKILQKASRMNLKSYENSETYDMVSRAQYEAEGKLLTFFESFVGVFSNIITTVSYLLIIVRFRIWIMLCILVIPVIKFLNNRKINRETFYVIQRRTNDSRKCWYAQHLLTCGDTYKELKIYDLFQHFIGKFCEYKERFNLEDLQLKKKSTLQLGCASILETIIDGLIFSYIVLCGYTGEILIGNVVAYMKTVTQVKTQVMSVLQTISNMNQESMFIDQLREYLNFPEEDNLDRQELVNINHIESIEIRHLYYRYKENQEYVLKDINFKIDGTQIIAIVGLNGSGKTTLLKILMGFYDDYEGEVLINGIELKKISKASMLARIATLFQDFYQYEATFRENIAYGNLNIFEDDANLWTICKKFDLDHLIDETDEKLDCQIGYWFDNGKQISIGQWQKVGLARTFSKNADLYIMDEPNAALDAITEQQLSVLYTEILERKKGIIVVHKFNNFVRRVDRIIVLEHGEITGNGTHEELLESNKTYKKLYSIQIGQE